jgi:dTDP-4-amino-4,6-dideoxygalactose transaminase
LPIETQEAKAVFHVFVVRVEDSRREELRRFLGECGIETRVYYAVPLPFLKGYTPQHLSKDAYPEAVRASRELLALPSYPELKDSAVEFIGQRIREFYESPRRGQRGPI